MKPDYFKKNNVMGYWLTGWTNSKFYMSYGKIILLAVSLLVISCHSSQPTHLQPSAVKSYGVLILGIEKAMIYSDYPSTIQGQQNVEIRPKIDGYLENLYVDEGSVVKKGQLLFRISAPMYEQDVRTAEANIKIAQADLNAAAMQVNKVRPLVEQNIISNYELQAAGYNLQSKQATLAQAEAKLINARTNLSYASIYSPANGVIGALPFKIGSLVNSTNTQPLTTVSNIQRVYAYFSINEKQELDFFSHTKGNTLQQKLATFPPVTLLLPNGVVYDQKGSIETIGGLVNISTGSVSLRATFPNPDGMIRSGSSATVRIPVNLDSVLLVPESATYQIQGKLFVYVVAADSSVHSVAIQVNPNTTGNCYVVKSGLTPGQKIIIEGVANLTEGSLIQPRLAPADSVYSKLSLNKQ